MGSRGVSGAGDGGLDELPERPPRRGRIVFVGDLSSKEVGQLRGVVGLTLERLTDLTGPNGLAFSPDEKFFYVDDWDVKKKVVMRYRVEADGTLSHGEVFFDMTSEPGEQALDGMKIDQQGNLYVSGPGGVWIISPAAKHLGTIKAPELPANFPGATRTAGRST